MSIQSSSQDSHASCVHFKAAFAQQAEAQAEARSISKEKVVMKPEEYAFHGNGVWFMPRESYHTLTDFAALVELAKSCGLQVVGCTLATSHEDNRQRLGIVLRGFTNGYLDSLLHLQLLEQLPATAAAPIFGTENKHE